MATLFICEFVICCWNRFGWLAIEFQIFIVKSLKVHHCCKNDQGLPTLPFFYTWLCLCHCLNHLVWFCLPCEETYIDHLRPTSTSHIACDIGDSTILIFAWALTWIHLYHTDRVTSWYWFSSFLLHIEWPFNRHHELAIGIFPCLGQTISQGFHTLL